MTTPSRPSAPLKTSPRFNTLAASALALLLSLAGSLPARAASTSSPASEEIVLFGFDNRSFPFQNHVETHLYPGVRPRIVLRPGPPGSHDETILYYGTVIRIGDTFHMWYNGNYGPFRPLNGFERKYTVICYATSKDGINWEKPNLGLVEFNGSKDNNIVDFPEPLLWSTAAVLYDPEDPDPARRFKLAYEGGSEENPNNVFRVAFSPDGLHWTPSPKNPVGPMVEMAGITKHRGLYYVSAQNPFLAHRPVFTRRMVTYVSKDFETWSSSGAVTIDPGPDVRGPSTEDDRHQYSEIHCGAGLWNRGNVIVGIHGMWQGHPTGDRRLTSIDLGLVLSHDAIHFHEPVPGFRIIPAREQPESPIGVYPALMQGQGMENVGDETLYWYSLWRGNYGSGVRLITWARDRLGGLHPFRPRDHVYNTVNPQGRDMHHALAMQAEAISTTLDVTSADNAVFINASGLGQYSELRVDVLDEGFHPVPGFSGDQAAVVNADGFRSQLEWPGGTALPTSAGPLRLRVRFEGVRGEDGRLHAVYVTGAKVR
jgi:hypothetical protein